MAPTGLQVLDVIRHPRRMPAALLRRIMPNSPRYGFPWVQLPDGSVTFREAGFVAASSPSMLLARHNYEVARLHSELGEKQYRRSLEIGCGFGRLSTAIAMHTNEHIAVDINRDALAAARAAYPAVDFRSGGAQSLPFPDHHFDLVVTWTVLQHIRPGAIESACGEVLRVLAPDGALLICEETRNPDDTGGHTWHRQVAGYARLFAPLQMVRQGPIDEIQAISGMESPGTVMLFRR